MLDSWGMEFRKDATGTLPSASRDAPHLEAVVFPGYKMQKKLRWHPRKLGVIIVDRGDDTELPDLGRPCGRDYGLQCPHWPILCVRSEEYGPFHGRVQLSVTVPRAGHGVRRRERHGPARGRGIHQHGIRHLQRHRQGLRHLRHELFPVPGRLFHQRPGETFMHKYDPVQGEGAMLHILVRAMTQEVRAGRGPISFDLRGMSEEDKDLSRGMLPMFFEACASKGVAPLLGTCGVDPGSWVPPVAARASR